MRTFILLFIFVLISGNVFAAEKIQKKPWWKMSDAELTERNKEWGAKLEANPQIEEAVDNIPVAGVRGFIAKKAAKGYINALKKRADTSSVTEQKSEKALAEPEK